VLSTKDIEVIGELCLNLSELGIDLPRQEDEDVQNWVNACRLLWLWNIFSANAHLVLAVGDF